MARTKTDYIVVHCSATKPNMDIGAKEIRKWHTDPKPKGNGWNDIGYNDVIRRDGTVEKGRGEMAIGAHVAGYNAVSYGVCMVGGIDKVGRPENNFTDAQWKTLRRILKEKKAKWPNAKIVGHRDLNPGKACPSFDVAEYLRENPL